MHRAVKCILYRVQRADEFGKSMRDFDRERGRWYTYPGSWNPEGLMTYLFGEYVTPEEFDQFPISSRQGPSITRINPLLGKMWLARNYLYDPEHLDMWAVTRNDCVPIVFTIPPWSGRILKE